MAVLALQLKRLCFKNRCGLMRTNPWYLLWCVCGIVPSVPIVPSCWGQGHVRDWLDCSPAPLPTYSLWNRLGREKAVSRLSPGRLLFPQHNTKVKTTLLRALSWMSAEIWKCGCCFLQQAFLHFWDLLKLGITRYVSRTMCSFQGFLWGLRICHLWLGEVYNYKTGWTGAIVNDAPLTIYKQNICVSWEVPCTWEWLWENIHNYYYRNMHDLLQLLIYFLKPKLAIIMLVYILPCACHT